MSATSETLNDSVSLESVEATVEQIMNESWYWFPVRHHSPGTAHFLRTAIEERKPKLILIEGPSESNHLIPALQDVKTKPPIAIYSCFEDTGNQFNQAGIRSASEETAPRWACWFPFMEYSPELVAIRSAAKTGATVRFIDLPHYARLAIELTPDDGDHNTPKGTNENEGPELDRNYETEKLIAESNFYQSLASAGGYQSWDEGWDVMFEFRDFETVEEFRRELLTFCAAARMTSDQTGPEHAETLDRERFMLRAIKQEIKSARVNDDEVMIVCGGFHTSLDRDDPVSPPEIPKGNLYTTLVPYSYFQVADISGYGAGNRAPRFYQSRWEALNGKIKNPLAQYIVTVLQAARKKGENLSAADSISISQHARMLAALRGREYPILDDMQDAIMTCCCKGNPDEQGATLKQVIAQINIGNRIGKTPPTAPRLPVVDDFYKEVGRLELSEWLSEEKLRKVELDKRVPIEQEKSAFFYRLSYVEVPFSRLEGNPQSDFESGLIFREKWALKWSPSVEAKLIERSLLGDSIEAIAVNQLKQNLVNESGNAGLICRNLVSALQMNLPNVIDQVFQQALSAIEEDGRFLSLAESVVQLQILDRHAIHQELRREKITDMGDRSFARACFAMPEISTAPDEHHPQIVDALTALADIALKANKQSSQRQLFADAAKTTFGETSVPFLKGALLGILVEIKIESHQAAVNEIRAYAFSSPEQMVAAGDFIHGVLSVSRASLMAGAVDLVDAIDDLIRQADWEIFVLILPRLRAAMELLHRRHRDSLASRVAQKYGLKESESLQELDVTVEIATEIAALDKQVAEIMKAWSFDDD